MSPPRDSGALEPGLRFHRSYLPMTRSPKHDGIPVTTVPRTLFDLAAVVSPGQLNRAVNEAEIRRLWDPLSLDDLLIRHPRRPGAAALRAVLATPGASITRSELEDRFLDLLRRRSPPADRRRTCPIEVNGVWIEADCMLARAAADRRAGRTCDSCHEVRLRERPGPRPRAGRRRLARDEDHLAPAAR